jgi:tyrosyl-tRNA synthetase
MQGYDSVALQCDVELGGTDQKFNLLCGRELQRHYGQKPQIVLMTPILEGYNGVQKMSKSFNNAIGINEPPQEMYAKVMKISDELMWQYWTLLTDVRQYAIDAMRSDVASGTLSPMATKKQLARTIVSGFHGEGAAWSADKKWAERVQHKEFSADTEEVPLAFSDLSNAASELKVANLLTACGITNSNSEAQRKLKERAVWINDEVWTKPTRPLNPRDFATSNPNVPQRSHPLLRIRVGNKSRIVILL